MHTTWATGWRSAALALPLAPTLALALALGPLAAGCSSQPEIVDRLGDLPEEEQTRIDEYTSRQMQIGYQIASTASQDDALLLCYEMCNRSAESCILSGKVCDAAAANPKNGPLGARCDVTRERCRVHRTKVPRQCPCDFSPASAANRK